jgi:hypothetical protein
MLKTFFFISTRKKSPLKFYTAELSHLFFIGKLITFYFSIKKSLEKARSIKERINFNFLQFEI